MQIGWICPKCNRGVNPNLNHCDCDNGQYTPFQPFTPKPFNPIEEIKKVVENTTTVSGQDRIFRIIY